MKPISIILISCVLTCAVVFLGLFLLRDAWIPNAPDQAVSTEASAESQMPPEADHAPLTVAAPDGMANVLDYGADPTGKEDSTEAIQTACNKNRIVYFPAGTYLFDRLTISGSVTLQGAGDNATFLKTTDLTKNVITFKANSWHVKDLKFDAVADRTDGAYIYSGSDYASIENVAFTRHYIGIDLDGSWSVNITNISAFDGTPHQVAEGGCVIRLGNNAYTGPVNIRGLTAKPTDETRQPTAGIHLGYVDVVSISDALLIWHRKDVLIAPKGPRQFAALVEITNCCFDTASNGVFIEPTNDARVLRCGISNTWFGAHSDDALHIDASDGVVTGLQFTNCMFLANRGDGVYIAGEGVDGLYFDNSFSGGNLGNGLTVTGGAKDVVWSGGVLGSCHELAGNVGYGYNVAEDCDVQMLFPDLEGNSLGEGRGSPTLYTREDLMQTGGN